MRVTNPHTLAVTPLVLFTKLKGASTYDGDVPEQRLLMAVLERFITDLALCGDTYMTKEGFFLLREARIDLNFAPLWYLKFLGLQPEYVRHQLEINGYVPPIRWRRVERSRVKHFGLQERIAKLERSNWHAYVKKQLLNAGILKAAKQAAAQQPSTTDDD